MSELIQMKYVHVEGNSWSVKTDGVYASVIKNHLQSKGIPEISSQKILLEAAKILTHCPNPIKKPKSKITGLAIGKVQSGKTSNFISLCALAFDNHYDFVVLLGGTKKLLVDQNSERLEEYFKSVQSNVAILNINKQREFITEENIQKLINMGRKVVIVTIKNATQINRIRKNVFSGHFINEKPLLVIDDEGDEASPNTMYKQGEESKTYAAIARLRANLHCHCYLSVTATPQANIFINTLDELSPDFGILIDPGNEYCGLNEFHGEDSKLTITIPDNEDSLLDDGVPPSFLLALSMYFIACGIHKYRGSPGSSKLSLLVHPSQLKADHNQVYYKIKNLLVDWMYYANNKHDIAYPHNLKAQLLNAYHQYASKIANLPPFELIEENTLNAIKYCQLHIVNGDSVPEGTDLHFDYNIYVGGTLLGRGLTISGLMITYIIRTAKGVSNVDTVQQRARWLGYKSKYLDLCRVFATTRILNDFSDIRDHEEDLWDTVRLSNYQGLKFKELKRIFTLGGQLQPTRSSVASTVRFGFSIWQQQRIFQDDLNATINNEKVIANFWLKHERKKDLIKIGEGLPYEFIRNLTYSEVFLDLISKLIIPEGSKFDVSICSRLVGLLKKVNIDPAIDVIWMRKGDTSKHSITVNQNIPEYMVGRRPQDSTLPLRYSGDKTHFLEEGRMQLQIHLIEDSTTKFVSPAFALYTPPNVLELLPNLVVGSQIV